MSAILNSLSNDFGLVIAAGVFMGVSTLITLSHAGAQRKRLGVDLPNLYASEEHAKADPKAKQFNAMQRGAFNPLESVHAAYFGLLTGGLASPTFSAIAGFAWGIGALLYYAGYATGNPEKRYGYGGMILRLAQFYLLLSPLYTAYVLYRR